MEVIKPRAESIGQIAGRLNQGDEEHSGPAGQGQRVVFVKLALFLLATLLSGLVTYRILAAPLGELIRGMPAPEPAARVRIGPG
jgi:hypothetical protein